jgi:predicted DNA binding protein
MLQDIIQVKLEIFIPNEKWLFKFSNNYPELHFQILSSFLMEKNRGITLFQIKGHSIQDFLLEFTETFVKNTYHILYESTDLAIFNIKTEEAWIIDALTRTELLIFYPITVREGKINIEAITERNKVDHFLNILEEKSIKFSIAYIGYYHRPAILTPKQKKILNIAYNIGLFDIPRKIKVSDLAKNLKISPSAVSEILRRITKRLARNFIMNQD